MEETKEEILNAAVQRVIERLVRWQPTNPTLLEIKGTLIHDLPGLIRGEQ
jgi:hypothetical protein